MGDDLIPNDEKKQWPAFKPYPYKNKEFKHFKDREDWPFRNRYRRKFPWRKTDSQRFGRKDYEEYDISHEQASRKAILDDHYNHDDNQYGDEYDPFRDNHPYNDRYMPKKDRKQETYFDDGLPRPRYRNPSK